MRTFNIEDNEIIVYFYACLEKFADWFIELIQIIFENQFLKFVFYMWFVLFCLALVLWFLFDNYEMFDSMSIRKGNEFKKENKRLLRQSENEARYERRRKENEDRYFRRQQQVEEKRIQREIQREADRIMREDEREKKRLAEWDRRHPNVTEKGEQYANAYFKTHPNSVAFNYNGVTYYNNDYLEKLLNSNVDKRSYDLGKAIQEAYNGNFKSKKNIKSNDDNN